MEFLPKELEDIINDYKYQMEHKEKFDKCMIKINKITYRIERPQERPYGSRVETSYRGIIRYQFVMTTDYMGNNNRTYLLINREIHILNNSLHSY